MGTDLPKRAFGRTAERVYSSAFRTTVWERLLPRAFSKSRVIVNDNKSITLGAGTDYTMGGQIACFEINMNHPAMQESLKDAEEQMNTKLVHFPDGAALSPPSTSG